MSSYEMSSYELSSYEWALFFHIVGAIIFFAGMAVAGIALEAARKRVRPSEVALLLRLTRWGVALVGLGTLVVTGFGVWLVELTGDELGDAWLIAALALLGVATALGAIGGRVPKKARLLATRLAAEDDAMTAELRRLLDDRVALASNYLALAASVAILVLMVWRPGA